MILYYIEDRLTQQYGPFIGQRSNNLTEEALSILCKAKNSQSLLNFNSNVEFCERGLNELSYTTLKTSKLQRPVVVGHRDQQQCTAVNYLKLGLSEFCRNKNAQNVFEINSDLLKVLFSLKSNKSRRGLFHSDKLFSSNFSFICIESCNFNIALLQNDSKIACTTPRLDQVFAVTVITWF